jgi:hypothetical protein
MPLRCYSVGAFIWSVTMQTGFLPVFEQKFKKLLKSIENEYAKPKKERNVALMKTWSKEAKNLRKIFRDCKHEIGGRCCPNCGHDIED